LRWRDLLVDEEPAPGNLLHAALAAQLAPRGAAQRDAQKGLGAFDDAARRGPEQ
jgi:hypothetical protein